MKSPNYKNATDEAKVFCRLNTFGVNLFSQLNRFG